MQRFLLILLTLLLMGCGPNYAEQIRSMRTQLNSGNVPAALTEANKALGVDLASQLPEKNDELVPLLLLERATLLQADGQYKLSARDIQIADEGIEILDLSQSTAEDIAQYLFSDAMGDYKMPPYEKLLVNTIGILNYLSLGDLDGARVEARRIEVLKSYFKTTSQGPDVALGLGAYLAAFTFEKRGQLDEALRWYDTALSFGSFPSARYAVGYLMKQRELPNDRLQSIAKEQHTATPPAADEGELLIVIESGFAPYREAKRIPIGLALTIAATDPGWRRSPDRRRSADRLAAEGLFKWVNYPELHKGHANHSRFKLNVGSNTVGVRLALDVEAQAQRYFESIRPQVVIASITRLITRAAASAATEKAINSGKKKNDSGLAGFLIGKAVEGAMVVADTPDTRSWNSLPQSFWIARVRLPAGTHQLRFRAHGARGLTRDQEITLEPGGWSVVVLRAF